jgi:hypothetical protein
VIIFYLEKLPLELINDTPFLLNILVPSYWSLKIARICKAIGPDGTKIRDNKVSLVNFSDVSPSFAIKKID